MSAKSYKAVFKITREYVVNFDAASEERADEICEKMEVGEIEANGAASIDVEILSLQQYAEQP